jgi:peptidoglycan/xylan/chitin deacetylase (PgdA/CDA1 family)
VRFSELAHAPDFSIGNHSWTHQNNRVLSGDRLMTEIRSPLIVFAREAAAPACPATTAYRPSRLYRFPFGACDAESMAAVNDAGLLAIQWDVSTGDPSPGQSAQAIIRETLAHVRPGSIILAHANGRGWHTAEALPTLIRELRARGYQFVTVEELLSFGKPVIASTCYDARPGDTDHYDHFLGAGLFAKGKISR